MEYTESIRKLPQNLKVPLLRSKRSLDNEREIKGPPDFSDRGRYIGHLSHYIHLEGEGIFLEIDKPEKLFSIIEKHRHTFVVMPLNYVSVLWKGFSENFQTQIIRDPNLWANEGSWSITKPSPRKIIFRNGNKWYTLWILQTNKVLGDPNKLIDGYFELNSYGITPNPAGIPASGRDFLFGTEGPGSYNRIREEFTWIRYLLVNNPQALEDFYSGCKRPVMACSTLGRISPSWNRDMIKAFLLALIHTPTMSPYLTVPDETPTFNPEASHGIYLVKALIPPNWSFSPNLFRIEDSEGDFGVISPTGGAQIQLVGQLRLNLWNRLNIPFSVIRAFKLLPAGGIEYPWTMRGNFLMMIVDNIKKKGDLPIDSSLLYQAAIGSLLTNYEYHNRNGENNFQTLNVFNPILQLHIYEWVFITNWLEMLKHPPQSQLALRIDAHSFTDYRGYKPEDSSFYRLETPVPRGMFFINPRQKDKDVGQNAIYLDAIKEAVSKDQKEAHIFIPTVGTLEMLQSGLIGLEDYGKKITVKSRLNIGGETREPKDTKYKNTILPADLLDNQIELVDPNFT